MATKGTKQNESNRFTRSEQTSLPADFPLELLGEFGSISEQLATNIGTIASLTIGKGGYFGISVSDDRCSAKLVVRTALLNFERRVYKTADLEKLLAYSLGKLRV
jgi:hypothetical protein